jgi:putative adenylate-forming enzyme
MIERLSRMPTALRALRAARGLETHERWSPEQLHSHQRERLLAIVRDAAARSPYYRERFAGIELSDDLELAALPRLDKPTMLEHFDELVTDRRLSLAEVERHVAELEGAELRSDPKLFGEYRVLASGGTSGRRGVFLYSREDWTELLGGGARIWRPYLDFAPHLPRRRLVTIVADQPLHANGRVNRSIDVGIHRMLRLDARAPIGGLVRELNDFRPEGLFTYPSTAGLLAERQLAGDLTIGPRWIVTGGEVLSDDVRERIVAAFDREPFDGYGTTEVGYVAVECDRHAGLHVFEDQVQIEIVDDEYRPVPAGQPGTRLLVTNLVNRTQPLIRYELDDLVTASAEPCPCGRPFPLLKAIEGRSDDILELPARGGGTTKIHPVTLRSPLAGIAALSEYRILYRAGELRIEAVLAGTDGRRVCQEIESSLGAALAESGAQPPPIHVESVTEIPRHPHSGKHKAIEVEVS